MEVQQRKRGKVWSNDAQGVKLEEINRRIHTRADACPAWPAISPHEPSASTCAWAARYKAHLPVTGFTPIFLVITRICRQSYGIFVLWVSAFHLFGIGCT